MKIIFAPDILNKVDFRISNWEFSIESTKYLNNIGNGFKEPY